MKPSLKTRPVLFSAAVLVAALSFAARVEATTLDLTTLGSSGFMGTGYFTQGGTLSGTGVFPAFVQIGGNNPIHGAYNTTVNNVLDNGASNQFNHAVQVSDLVIVNIGGVDYYQFLLDINEDNNTIDKWLSLDMLTLITSTTANQSSTPLPSGPQRWDLGTGNVILLDYSLNNGSGKFDMSFFAPVSAFAGAASTDYVYLFSSFGGLGLVSGKNWGASDGFEEWALNTTAVPCDPTVPGNNCQPLPDVPEPATLVLLGTGLAVVAFRLRRKAA